MRKAQKVAPGYERRESPITTPSLYRGNVLDAAKQMSEHDKALRRK